MAINSNYSTSGWNKTILASLVDIRTSLNQESLKMSTGRIANTYAELGSKVAPTLDLRARLNSIDTYADLISTANNTIGQVSQALTSFNKLIDTSLSGPLSLAGGSDKLARSSAGLTLQSQFSTLITYLNNEDISGYSFGGDKTGVPPVSSSDVLLNGIAGKAGLKQLFSERFAADSGADGLGRLALSNNGSTVTIAETATMPFGLKLSTITSSLTNSTVTGPTGTPPSASLSLSGQPNSGDQVTFKFNLPDGSTSSITLTAGSTAGTNQFAIGSTPVETAQNVKTALTASLSQLVATDLYSASALYTAKNFFASTANNPPERVSGTPASSATAVTAGTDANTVIWYQGKSDNTDPRGDRKIQIGDDISVEFGVRANESGFQSVLAGITSSLLVASNFSSNDTIAARQMEAVRTKSYAVTKDGQINVQSIVTTIASSQVSAKMIDQQNKSVKSLLQTRLAEFEDAKPEETAAKISSLTTQLQASYQVASKLLNLSLSAFL